MKYSAEELYNWSLENDYKDKLVEAQFYNNMGYDARPLEGSIVEKDGQFYYRGSLSNGAIIEETIGDGSEKQNKILARMQNHPELIKASLVSFDKKYHILMAFGETEEERKESLEKKTIIDMFTLLEIDTTGKAKKLADNTIEVKASKIALGYIAQGLKKKNDEK